MPHWRYGGLLLGRFVGTLVDSAVYWFVGVHIGIAVGSIVGDLAVISVGNMVGALVGIAAGLFTCLVVSRWLHILTTSASQRRLLNGVFTMVASQQRWRHSGQRLHDCNSFTTVAASR